MAVIDDLTVLLPDQSTAILNLYIRKATTAIVTFMNNITIVPDATAFPDAVIQFVTECVNKSGNEGLQSFSQGGESGSYTTGIISDATRALLPVPYAKLQSVSVRRSYGTWINGVFVPSVTTC